ncbi:MAG: hypothetical protein AB1498_07805, partial [bacterium]
LLGESLLKKVIGKPCEGKLQARFDEGMLETERKFCASVLLYNKCNASDGLWPRLILWRLKMKTIKEKTSNNIVGIAGEYYVCAELCKRGYLSLMTHKNNPLFDVVVTNADGSKMVAIQVKTMSIRNKQGWKLGKDISIKQNNENLFVVLVNLFEEGLPEFFIYEYDILSEIININYKKYLETPKKDGTKKKDIDFRWHDFKSFTDEDKKRKNNWESIGKKLI